MLGTIDLSTYLAGLAVIVLLPGPNSLYVLSVAARRGPRTAYRAAAGVVCGDTVLMTLSAGGVASLLKASPVAFDVVKFAGTGYLTWLAVGMMRGARRLWRERVAVRRAEAAEGAATEVGALAGSAPSEVPDVAPANAAARRVNGAEPVERPYRRALIVSLFNPKAILFFIAFFVQFVDPHYARSVLSFVYLGAWAQLFSITYLTVLIYGGSYLAAAFRRRHRLAAGLSAGAGALFLGFAAKLSLAGAGS